MPLYGRRKVLSLATAAIAASAFAGAASGITLPSRSGLSWASGARAKDPDQFSAMRGRSLDVLTTFGGRGSWADIQRRSSDLAPLLSPDQGNRQEVIVVTYPIFPDNKSPRVGGSPVWMAAARGNFDAHHIAAADGFKRYSQKFIFRVGHEWNCCYPWRCLTPDMAPYYKDYFRRIVDIFRARHPSCLIDWCSVKRRQNHSWHP